MQFFSKKSNGKFFGTPQTRSCRGAATRKKHVEANKKVVFKATYSLQARRASLSTSLSA